MVNVYAFVGEGAAGVSCGAMQLHEPAHEIESHTRPLRGLHRLILNAIELAKQVRDLLRRNTDAFVADVDPQPF
jgi:hypothetical protein